ncbi:MAG TPA: flagellin [Holophaga sp.]|jgi:flagellin|nr:flagellin [Holophaga sp.]
MVSILNNVAALGASRQLEITNGGLQKTIERLTTGRRINRASDDAAGLGISNKLGADIRIANQGKRNANDGVSYLQVADGVLDEVTNLLTRAAELSEQAKTGTISNSNRTNIDAEFQNIIKSIADIGVNTTFNGASIYGAAATVSVGTFSPIGISIPVIASSTVSALGLTANQGATLGTNLQSDTAASAAAGLIMSALESVSNVRASIGATMQQITSISNSLGIQVENFTAAYSQIRDANISDEVVSLTKYQILNQSGTSALAQANQSAQSILSLLK